MKEDRKDPNELTQQLVTAARKLFAQKGFERATIDEIVSMAGCSKGAFYYYFDSKEGLFLEIMDRRVIAQQSVMEQALEMEKDLSENVSNILRLFFLTNEEDRWVPMFVEFLAQATRNEQVRVRTAKMYF